MSKLALLGGTPIRHYSLPKWPLATAKEKNYLNKVINSSGWGFFRGSLIKEFGSKFAEYQGAKFGIPCSNATVALQLQLQALNIGHGDEVITTVYTFMATITAITNVGAIPIFVDIREDNYCMDTELIEKKISKKTKAIIAVHLYGSLSNLDELARITRKYNLYLIEDAAQVPGSFWKNRGVGTFGIGGAFSFQESKLMTSGEGGIVITNDKKFCEFIYEYTNCGRLNNNKINLPRKVMGSNYRMTEFQAAVLLGQLEVLEERVALQEKNADYLNQKLSKMAGIGIIERNKKITAQSYYAYVLKYYSEVTGISREVFMRALEAEGIPLKKLYVPVYKDSLFNLNSYDTPEAWAYYESKPIHDDEYPIAERVGSKEGMGIWHPLLLWGQRDLDDIVSAIEKVITYSNDLKKNV